MRQHSPAPVSWWGTSSRPATVGDAASRVSTVGALALDLYRLHYYVFVGTVLAVARDFRDGFHDLVALDDLAENCVLAGQPIGVANGDEELRSVGVGAGIGHGQLASFVETMRRALGFVFELVAGTAETGAHRIAAQIGRAWCRARAQMSM